MSERDALISRRTAVVSVLTVTGLVIAVAIGVWSAGDDRPPANLPTRTAEAGDVTVKATPLRIGPDDAVFALSLVATSSDVSFSIEAASTLTVGGTEWEPATWDGPLPSSGAREGRLEFHAKGPVRGTAVLRIGGLPAPVTLTWDL